eukprot:gene5850-9673_t
MVEEVYIASYVRTPMGNFGGELSNISATDLGAICIKEAVKRANINSNQVEEVFMGNVCSSNLGQAPARQCALKAGLSLETPCTQINKVCASGMKSVMIAAQSIQLGKRDCIIAGGTENMSKVPFFVETNRFGQKLGNSKLEDGLLKDGLTNPFNSKHMGLAGEKCAEDYNITREQQDNYALLSMKRAREATEKKKLEREIVEVEIKKRNQILKISKDEELKKKINPEKLKQLNSAFKKNGTVTAGNASLLSDGASALVLVSKKFALKNNLKVIAKILSFDDAAQDPMDFTTTPSIAVKKCLKSLNMSIQQIDFHEVNEAFSVVALANSKILGVDINKVNVYGGGVSLGHPLGSSGSRIIGTLCNVLENENGKIGCASICNGGGGGSAIIIEKVNNNLLTMSKL